MNCLEANNQRILMQKIESQLYSTTLSTLQGEWNIVLTTKETRRNDFCVCPFPIKRSTTHSKFSVYFYYPNWTGGSSANLRQAWYGLTTKEYAQNVTCYPSLSPILLTNDSLRCSRSSSEKTYPVILNCYKKKVLCTRMVIQTTFSSSHHLLNLHSFLYI